MDTTRKSAMGPDERRRHERVWVVRGCRIRAVHRVRSEQAETTNISESGALIRVGSEGAFGVGDEVEILVAWEGESVVRSDEAVRGVVKRVVPMDYHHQAIGVEFGARVTGRIAVPRSVAHAAAA